jgi:PST family polysaccharide transporter
MAASSMDARWLKYLPGFIRTRLQGRRAFQAALGNSGWLVADRIVRLGVGLFVGVWIARYLGPQQYGLWNFAIAFAALFGAFATLGLDNIVVRELVRRPDRKNAILGSAFALKVGGGTLALALSLLALSLVRRGDPLTLLLVGITAAGFVFQAANVIGFFFQANVQSKYAVYAANAAFLVTTAVKIALLVTAAPLVAFAWAGLAETVLAALFLATVFHRSRHRMRDWRFEGRVAGELVRECWPLMLAAVAILVSTRIDQIMIGQMLDDAAVGLYSAAVRISEVWYFVPVALATSVFPSLLEVRKQDERLYRERLQRLLDTLVLLSLAVAIAVTVAADPIVSVLFGSTYAGSAAVLKLHTWAGVFVALSVGAGGWFLAEGLQKHVLRRTMIGAAIAVALNLYLVPRFGILGAAWSIVAAQAFCVFSNALTADTRVIFWMQMRALGPGAVCRLLSMPRRRR